MRLAALSCLAICIAANALVPVSAEDEPVFSGPQPGEKLVSFKIKNVLVEPAKEVDLIASADGKPVLIVFFHKRTRPAFGLTNTLMKYALTRTKAGLTSGVAFLTEDTTETENWVKRVRGNLPKGATYGVSPDGIEGPGAYGLNREVELTILIGNKGKTTANFALVQPSLEADGPKIAKALAAVLGDEKPVDLAKFAGGRMRKDKAKPKRPAANPRGNPVPADLRARLVAVIRKENTPEEVDKAAKALEKHLAENKESAKTVGEITTRIIKAGGLERYGTERAREYLTKWSKEYGPKDDDPKPKAGDKARKDADRKKPAATATDKKTDKKE
jgi:hypothetical protein